MTLEQLITRLRGAQPRLVDILLLYASVASTNQAARRVVELLPANLSLPETLIVALEQSGGRGRFDRVWVSPPGGGLYASLVWPLEDRRSIAALPLAVAVGLCAALRSVGVPGCQVKWPNDLVIGGRKVGGILIEAIGPAAGRGHAVIGFGINLAMEREKLDALAATSLERETSDAPDLADLVISCTREVRRELGGLDDRSALVDRYRDLVVHQRGDRLIWRQACEVVEGSYRGIDATGCLELETESGLRVVNAGEIVVG